MGTVFLAHDVTLKRPVAIKIIPPELATASAAKRFLREAQILANLKHPNVMPVHAADEADGLFYYIMDFFEGETLADRLHQGPLSLDEARKLGRDLLDALEAVHGRGIVHRDIKPSNIFLIDRRAVLADFGIARRTPGTISSHQTVETPGGTPGYMAPEQAFTADVTPQADTYAVGVVLYEALTGRRWSAQVPGARPDWSGVTRPVKPILRRALQWDPERRWPDAASFRRKLWRTRTTRYRRRTFNLTVSGLTVGAGIAWFAFRPERSQSDVAVVPCAVTGGADVALGDRVTLLVGHSLAGYVSVASDQATRSRWRQLEAAGGPRTGKHALEELLARNVVFCSIAPASERPDIRLEVIDRRGNRIDGGTVPWLGEAEIVGTARQLGFRVARLIGVERYSGPKALSPSDPALSAFIDGEVAFRRNAARTAVDRYGTALELDRSFVLAAWRRSVAWHWLSTGSPYPFDLKESYERHRDALGELDRRLFEAQLTPGAPERFRRYREAIEKFPADPYARFFYADELLHRGPYIGIPTDDAVAQLDSAVQLHAALAPALDHLVWAYIRDGKRPEARNGLNRLWKWSAGPAEAEIYTPPLLELGFAERFDPQAADSLRLGLLGRPDMAAAVAEALRFAAMLGLPLTQVELATLIGADPRLGGDAHGDLHMARALGLVALGRIAEALPQFDSASTVMGTMEARLQAAEWRVIAPALGLPGFTQQETTVGRTLLQRFESTPAARARTAWASGLDALARGDPDAYTSAAARLDGIPRDSGAMRLRTLLTASYRASQGEFETALRLTEPLLAFDSAGTGGDPFARAVLHLQRASWRDSLGRGPAADSARLWYEHFESNGTPRREAQAAEIDWALATYAMWIRGVQAHQRGLEDRACAMLRRVLELWAGADPAYQEAIQRATAIVQACRR
jgi:hypothetical protein